MHEDEIKKSVKRERLCFRKGYKKADVSFLEGFHRGLESNDNDDFLELIEEYYCYKLAEENKNKDIPSIKLEELTEELFDKKIKEETEFIDNWYREAIANLRNTSIDSGNELPENKIKFSELGKRITEIGKEFPESEEKFAEIGNNFLEFKEEFAEWNKDHFRWVVQGRDSSYLRGYIQGNILSWVLGTLSEVSPTIYVGMMDTLNGMLQEHINILGNLTYRAYIKNKTNNAQIEDLSALLEESPEKFLSMFMKNDVEL